ncbi:MAG: hypothetical protein IKQ93_02905 [Candidatus Methanomethylophilaceae archaeon]|nr:hypothetical protein [Candidatus Methanomethylophilaceae archaeon]
MEKNTIAFRLMICSMGHVAPPLMPISDHDIVDVPYSGSYGNMGAGNDIRTRRRVHVDGAWRRMD